MTGPCRTRAEIQWLHHPFLVHDITERGTKYAYSAQKNQLTARSQLNLICKFPFPILFTAVLFPLGLVQEVAQPSQQPWSSRACLQWLRRLSFGGFRRLQWLQWLQGTGLPHSATITPPPPPVSASIHHHQYSLNSHQRLRADLLLI